MWSFLATVQGILPESTVGVPCCTSDSEVCMLLNKPLKELGEHVPVPVCDPEPAVAVLSDSLFKILAAS